MKFTTVGLQDTGASSEENEVRTNKSCCKANEKTLLYVCGLFLGCIIGVVIYHLCLTKENAIQP